LGVEEQQTYNRDYHRSDSTVDSEEHVMKTNSSEDRIHLMVSWKVTNIYVASKEPSFFCS